MRIVHPALAVGLALALAACATTPAPGPVSVTRFVDPAAGARVAGENFFVESAPGSAMPPEQLSAYKAAVAAELTERGFVETSREGASMIAQVRAESTVAAPATRKRGPVSVGVGGSTGSYGSGVGLGLGINLGGGGSKETRGTELGVMLRDARTGATFWEGRAQFSVSVDSPLAISQANATAIADAMFREYPGNNGETTEVRVQE
jgi:hypothetical protein